jgi:hypothetical protein
MEVEGEARGLPAAAGYDRLGTGSCAEQRSMQRRLGGDDFVLQLFIDRQLIDQ